MELPCRFQLQRYPFGKQSCILNFQIDNTEDTMNNLMPSSHRSFNEQDTVRYYGSNNLGEYEFINSVYEQQNNNLSVSIIINLRSQFGYHILNSFIPSVLIFIISYTTFFFPISDFNERIMVSLTAVLVLAALSSQATNASVHTSYFKLLDLWYTTVLVFCFTVVITITVINSYRDKEISNVGEIKVFPEKHVFRPPRNKKAHLINFWFQLILMILFLLTVFMFVMYAMELF